MRVVLLQRLRFCFLLPLLWVDSAPVSAQLAGAGRYMCQLIAEQASCELVSEGCPVGKTMVKTLPMYTPWLCGGGPRICCVLDSSSPTSPIDDTGCGESHPTGRILNGAGTSLCQWPFVVSLRVRVAPSGALTQGSTQHSCASVIIDNQWVLTHALCLFSTSTQFPHSIKDVVVVTGEYDVDHIDLDPCFSFRRPLERFLPVERAFLHPDFVRISTLYDINLTDQQQTNGNALALIKLGQPIDRSCASPACLPFASPLTSSSRDTFSQCVILGWGFDSPNLENTDGTLKQGIVRVYKNDACDFLQTHIFTSGPARFTSSACLTSDLDQDFCLGDQGGPVLCQDEGRWTVQGIIPVGHCFQNHSINPYVIDVTPYQDWIYDIIRRNQ